MLLELDLADQLRLLRHLDQLGRGVDGDLLVGGAVAGQGVVKARDGWRARRPWGMRVDRVSAMFLHVDAFPRQGQRHLTRAARGT